MSRSFFFGFLSNIERPLRGLVVEALVDESTRHHQEPSVFVNLDPNTVVPVRAKKPGRDTTAARYGGLLRSSDTPVLNRTEADEFFHDIARGKNPSLFEDQYFSLLLEAVPDKSLLHLFDALCFVVNPGHGTVPFVFDAVQKLRASNRLLPILILVSGEPRIEVAAEVFQRIQKDLGSLGGDYADCTFAGTVSPDPDEVNLAQAYGLALLQAFPSGTLHGQVRYATAKIFHRGHGEEAFDVPTRAQEFRRLCKG